MADQQTETPEPRCYGHEFDPAHQGGGHRLSSGVGWPAHVWGSGHGSPFEGKCQQCPEPIKRDDRYVCIKGGVIHVECVARLDYQVLSGDRDE